MNLFIMFVGIYFTVGGEPAIAGGFYITFIISLPLSIVAALLVLWKKAGLKKKTDKLN